MTDSATISLLPVSLSIVRVPRSRIHGLFHPLIRQLLLPQPTFLNLTCNELELSLFAEHHVLRDFEPIVRKDACRRDARTRSGGMKPRKSQWEPVELSAERWNVLQIDSHSNEHGEFPPYTAFASVECALTAWQLILGLVFTSYQPLWPLRGFLSFINRLT